MSDTVFNWGVIGPGRIAQRFANALKVIDDAQLYAVASSNLERANAFAQEFGAEQAYDSYAAMLADPKVDAVYIATPHRFHYQQTLQCLEAGKPVLCEKPLTVNAAQSQQLVDLARSKNLFLMEALWTRYLPIYDQVREWLDNDEIGEVKLLTSSFGFGVPRDMQDRLLNHELAGGALLDMGIYNIAISQWVFGSNPKSFTAQGHIGESNVDELTAVNLDFGEGRTSQFVTNLMAMTSNDFVIYGSKGHIRIGPFFWDTAEATLTVGDKVLAAKKPFRGTGFEYEAGEAMRCIREGLLESPRMTHADTLANMQLMDAIRAEIGLSYTFEHSDMQ